MIGARCLRGAPRKVWLAFSRAHLARYGLRPRFEFASDATAISLFLEHADGDVLDVARRVERVVKQRKRVELPLSLLDVFLADYAEEVRRAVA